MDEKEKGDVKMIHSNFFVWERKKIESIFEKTVKNIDKV